MKKVGGDVVCEILSLDMKKEGFWELMLPKDYTHAYTTLSVPMSYIVGRVVSQIFAEDEHSFVSLISRLVKVIT